MPVPARLAGVVLALTVAVAGCGQEGPQAEPSASAVSSEAPEAKPGLALTQGALVLPAVRSNPGAAYFTLTNTGTKPVTLAAIDVAGAGMAMLHETVEADGHSEMRALSDPVIPAGGSLVFAPGGKHVMVDAVPTDWKPGGSAEVTLVFADGDKLSAPLAIVAPGGM